MTSFFPDLNVWLALTDDAHQHHRAAWSWLDSLDLRSPLHFSRITQLGLLRLLTTEAVMGNRTRSIREAWAIYDRWCEDPRVRFQPEPREFDAAFRLATQPFLSHTAPKTLADSYLIAFARQTGATLVTFDRALLTAARKSACPVLTPAS